MPDMSNMPPLGGQQNTNPPNKLPTEESEAMPTINTSQPSQPETPTMPTEGQTPPSSPSPDNKDVYIMPENFQDTRSSGGGGDKVLIIVVIIFIVVAIISATYFFYDMWQKNRQETSALNVNQNVNINTNQNENTNLNTNENVNSDTGFNFNTNVNTNVATSTNENTNENLNTNVVPEPPEVSDDTDKDGLTDLEEDALGTDSLNPDTDEDGYIDSEEILNGYNPLLAIGGEEGYLTNSDIFDVIETNFNEDNFKVMYVSDWQTNLLPAIKQLVIITDTGESIKITVQDNVDELSIASWYINEYPNVSLSQIDRITVGDLTGRISPDKLAIYLTDREKTKIYSFEYMMEDELDFRYPLLFRFIVDSFEMVETVTPAPTSTSTATTTP